MRSFMLAPLLLISMIACADSVKATEHAWKYVKTNFPEYEVVSIQCDTADGDGNGAVRCNVSLRAPDGTPYMPNIECPSSWLPQYSSQCKMLQSAM